MKQRHVIHVIALTVVVIVGGMAPTISASDNQEISEQTLADVVALQDTANTTVTFENQTSNGSTVTVANVEMQNGGFVAIHTEELLEGSVLRSQIGVSEYLEPGEQENITVELNESIEEPQPLIAVVYQDTNDNQEYDFIESQGSADGPYTVNNQVVADEASVGVSIDDVSETETPVVTTTEDDVDDTETTVDTTTEEDEVIETTEVEDGETTEEDGGVETTTEVVEVEETTEEDVGATTIEEEDVGEPTTEDDETAVDTTTEEVDAEEPEPAPAESFNISSAQLLEQVETGDTARVSAIITNPNDEQVTQTVDVRIDGDVVERRTVTLEANEQVEVAFDVETEGLAEGEHFISIFTRDNGQITQFVATASDTPTETEAEPSEPTEDDADD